MVNTENGEQINLQSLKAMQCPVSQFQHKHHADSAVRFAFSTALALLSQGSPLLIQTSHGAAGKQRPVGPSGAGTSEDPTSNLRFLLCLLCLLPLTLPLHTSTKSLALSPALPYPSHGAAAGTSPLSLPLPRIAQLLQPLNLNAFLALGSPKLSTRTRCSLKTEEKDYFPRLPSYTNTAQAAAARTLHVHGQPFTYQDPQLLPYKAAPSQLASASHLARGCPPPGCRTWRLPPLGFVRFLLPAIS